MLISDYNCMMNHIRQKRCKKLFQLSCHSRVLLAGVPSGSSNHINSKAEETIFKANYSMEDITNKTIIQNFVLMIKEIN